MTSQNTIRFAQNSIFLMGTQLLSKIAGFGGIILLVRILDVDDFGVYSLALAVTGIISLFVELGLDQLAIREIARDKKRIGRYVANSALVKSVLSLLALILSTLVFLLTDAAPESRTIILIYVLAFIPAGAFHSLVAVFVGIERMFFVALLNAISELLRFMLFAVILLSGHGLISLAWSYVALMVLMVLVSFVILKLVVGNILSTPDVTSIPAMVRESIPFMLYGLFFVIYFKIDFIMLAWMKDEAMVGSYAAAYRLMESLLFVPAAFMGAVYPTLSRISTSGREAVLSASGKTLRYMAMIGIPFGVGTTVLAERLILFLFGSEYVESVLPLQIIIWAMVLIFINCICPVGLNSVNRQKLSMLVTGGGIIFNVALNLILIPPFGATGTSSSTVATEVLTTVIFFVLFSRHIGSLNIVSAVLRPLIASAAMAGMLIAFYFLPLWLLIIGAVMVYVLALIFFRAINRGDLDFFRSVLKPELSERRA